MARWPANRDLVEVTVLTLLLQQPRHPYELHRFILDTHKDFITGLPRSLYHAIDRLTDEELIEPVETARAGRRPERTVYQVTGEGRGELTTRLCRMLERAGPDITVMAAALSLMGCLPMTDAERSLQTRAAGLDGAVASADATVSGLRDSGLPRLLLLEVEYERAMRVAELEWVRALLAAMRAGEITWHGLMNNAATKETMPTEPGDPTDTE